MSPIDPIRRKDLPYINPATSRNDPAPLNDQQNMDTVEPVKPVNQTELRGDRRELSMDVDNTSDILVVRVADKKTKEVVYQVPSDRILELARERSRKAKRLPPVG